MARLRFVVLGSLFAFCVNPGDAAHSDVAQQMNATVFSLADSVAAQTNVQSGGLDIGNPRPELPPTAPSAYIWWFVILYMFYVMAAVCDEYLVPAVDIICEQHGIPEDVAGATLMAFACNGPETLTNVCAIFITHSSVGMGTIVGSAVFNVLVIVGCCPVATETGVLTIPPREFLRDASFSAISIVMVYWALPNIDLFKASVLFGSAIVYAVVVGKSKDWLGTAGAAGSELEEKLLEVEAPVEKDKRRATVIAPSTKDTVPTGDEPTKQRKLTKRNTWQAEPAPTEVKPHRLMRRNSHQHVDIDRASFWSSIVDGSHHKYTDVTEDMPLCTKAWHWFIYLLCIPTDVVLRWTIPDIKKDTHKHLYLPAFLLSMFWLSATSFVVCLGSDALNKYWGIPESFLGLTLVSIGTSFPNMWASVITAAQGRGPIAVSNALGSNVQNVFLVLAGPIWVSVILNGTYTMGGDDIMASIIWMGITLGVVVMTTVLSGFQLTKRSGYGFCVLYLVYVVQTTLSE